MTALPRSTEATELFRVIRDALWQLQHDYAIGAEAILRSAVDKERRRRDSDGVCSTTFD